MVRYAIIAGANYPNANKGHKLISCLEDARAMKHALFRTLPEKHFFQSTLITNPTKTKMWTTIHTVCMKLKPGDEVVFYFSGHGFECPRGNQYLELCGTRRQSLDDRSIALDDIQEALDQKVGPNGTTILIIDACRSLAPSFTEKTRTEDAVTQDALTNSRNSIRIYASGNGQTAYATEKENSQELSYFTRELVRLIHTPGLDIRTLTQQVRECVKKSTSVDEVKLTKDFYFVPDESRKRKREEEGERKRQAREQKRQKIQLKEITDIVSRRNFENGMECYLGFKKKEDEDRGKTLIEESAVLGFPMAKAFCQFHGWNSMKQDRKKAFDKFIKIDQTAGYHPWAKYMLGVCYSKGCVHDPTKAFQCYQASANLGNSKAMYNLGACYGCSVQVDSSDAIIETLK